jgi:hypothetical protein
MPANLFTKMDVTLGNSFSRLSTIGFDYHLSTGPPFHMNIVDTSGLRIGTSLRHK